MDDQHGLTPQELALLEPVGEDAQRSPHIREGGPVVSWPDPICLRRQLEVLESFHQDVSHRFADALSRCLQQSVEARLSHVEALSYSQFVSSRDDPTCFIVLQASPLPTSLVLDLAPPLFYPLIDCLLGGGQQPCGLPNRPPTELETRLIRGVVRALLDELHEAWEPLLAIDLSIERIESHARGVRVVAPSDAIASLVFQVNVANQTGELALCLPSRTIRKMVDKLLAGEYPDAAVGGSASEDDPAARQCRLESDSAAHDTTKQVAARPQMVNAQFTAESIAVQKLANLRPGDLILSELGLDSCVELRVGDRLLGHGLLGEIKGTRAVEIVEAATARLPGSAK